MLTIRSVFIEGTASRRAVTARSDMPFHRRPSDIEILLTIRTKTVFCCCFVCGPRLLEVAVAFFDAIGTFMMKTDHCALRLWHGGRLVGGRWRADVGINNGPDPAIRPSVPGILVFKQHQPLAEPNSATDSVLHTFD